MIDCAPRTVGNPMEWSPPMMNCFSVFIDQIASSKELQQFLRRAIWDGQMLKSRTGIEPEAATCATAFEICHHLASVEANLKEI